MKKHLKFFMHWITVYRYTAAIPLEAMAMGKALIAGNIGGHHTLITYDGAGLLFEPKSIDALAKALDQVLSDDAYRAELE